MQQLKQLLHRVFIKSRDFFGFKISMDLCMVFSLKMASKSKQFSMEKPSKKQDVFRASQTSFFLRSWSAPGQCPMTVFIFFSFFGTFGRKWLQKGDPFSHVGPRAAKMQPFAPQDWHGDLLA